MRLFYLLLTFDKTQGSDEAVEKVNTIIPKISAVLDARDVSLTSKTDKNSEKATPKAQLEACQTAIDELLKVIDTPELRQTIQILFSDIYPVQEALLSSIDHYLKQERLTLQDLLATLKIRAMDSVLYAGVIEQIIAEYTSPVGKNPMQFNQTYSIINATLQINDMVDAVIYAKQDLASKSATIVEIVRRIDPSNVGIENTIKQTFQTLETHIPDPNTHYAKFVGRLVGVVG